MGGAGDKDPGAREAPRGTGVAQLLEVEPGGTHLGAARSPLAFFYWLVLALPKEPPDAPCSLYPSSNHQLGHLPSPLPVIPPLGAHR